MGNTRMNLRFDDQISLLNSFLDLLPTIWINLDIGGALCVEGIWMPTAAHRMKVPTVTPDDLSAFHIRVFGSALPQSLGRHTRDRYSRDGSGQGEVDIRSGTHTHLGERATSMKLPEAFPTNQWVTNDYGEESENEDSLGYYPDGVRRTLTDEQIAMFRHSEVYAIQRERQVAKENREADGEDGNEMEMNGAETQQLVIDEHLLNDEWWNVLAASSEQTQMKAFDDVHHAKTDDVADEEFPERKRTMPTKGVTKHERMSRERDEKRKRRRGPENTNFDEVNEERKSRALVRDLDAMIMNNEALDYGDGEVDDGDKASVKLDGAKNNTHQPAREGKRIWWPVLSE